LKAKSFGETKKKAENAIMNKHLICYEQKKIHFFLMLGDDKIIPIFDKKKEFR